MMGLGAAGEGESESYLLPVIGPSDRARPNEHPWFDPWLGAADGPLRQLVGAIGEAIDGYEKGTNQRRRARKREDQRNHEIAVEVVIANLARAVLRDTSRPDLNIVTGNKSGGFTRYDNRALGKPLRSLLDGLGALGLLDRRLSFRRGVASSLRPTARFAGMIRRAGVSPSDLRRLPSEEVIWLRRKEKLRQRDESREIKEAVNYHDTPETIRMRAEVRRINESLATGNIDFLDDGLGPVDLRDRALRRIFVMQKNDPLRQRFDQGGRLFGGFWQRLQRDRRGHIRIEGEEPAYLDYSSMFLRLAYAELRVSPPAGDLYAIGHLEGHRPLVKMAVNALLFDVNRRTRWPQSDEPGPVPPPGWTWRRFRDALLDHHPTMESCFGKGLGLHLMYVESEIMVSVLTRLLQEGVVALPIHDGLLIKQSMAVQGAKVMEAVSSEIASAAIPVTITRLRTTT